MLNLSFLFFFLNMTLIFDHDLGINEKVLTQGIHLCNMEALWLTLLKTIAISKVDRETDRQGKNYMPPICWYWGIKKKQYSSDTDTDCNKKDLYLWQFIQFLDWLFKVPMTLIIWWVNYNVYQKQVHVEELE